jgi:G:T-mismatch repair DNA endonuclease (very short patch repair protein)
MGELKPNRGRFTSERYQAMSPEAQQTQVKRANSALREKLKDPIAKELHFRKYFKNSHVGYISKAQTAIYEMLKIYGYELEILIPGSGLTADILNIDKKIIVEYNGDFWHCNPKLYAPDYFHPILKMTAKEKWSKDMRRKFLLRNLGYHIITIWENEWMTDRVSAYAKLSPLCSDTYVFPEWIRAKPLALKGKTFKEIYGEERAMEMQAKISLRRMGKAINKDTMWRIDTPLNGTFYILKKKDWLACTKSPRVHVTWTKVPKNLELITQVSNLVLTKPPKKIKRDDSGRFC